MRESAIEKYLTRRVKEAGGLSWKFTSPSLIGVPDRIVVMPGNKVYFVEVKQLGEALRSSQERRAADLRARGCQVYILDSTDAVDFFMAVIS